MWAILYAIKRSWTQHFVTQFSAFTVMVLTYSAVLFIALSLTNIQSTFDTWGRINKVTVYLNKSGGKTGAGDLETWFKKNEMVKSFQLILPEESSKKFKDKFSKVSNHKLDAGQLEQFFPSYYELTLNESKSYHEGVETLDNFASQLKETFGIVQSVSYGKQWLQRYTTILNYIHRGGWSLIFLFLAAAVIISTSVIKTVLYSKREEIEILEFIGASEYSIYLPQLVNVLIVSLMAFSVGLGLNYLFYSLMAGKSQSYFSIEMMNSHQFLSTYLVIGILLLSLISCFAYSAITIFSLLPSRKKALLVDEVL